ncbi:hypothetical protein BDV3_005411 [Batrachochytrium dendrobatidis]|nr:Glucosaminyl phosphatidylinositol (GlcN-PI) nositol acylation protein [Batrachochytrium dendrobatidis]KAK5673182.1 Glucosaminyl phosphatidylinositol (GlcN-PI) nositol acylation protein [Batrachochytrium dendrobatidis]
MIVQDDAAKEAKQQHVQGHNGTTVLEIQTVLLVCLSSYLLWRTMQLANINPNPKNSLKTFLFEFSVLIIPVIMSITITEWTLTILAAQIAAVLGFIALALVNPLKGSAAKKQTKTAVSGYVPSSVAFRAFLQMLTVTAILAVDFSVFPRRFAKTEMYGTSLMDIGTGAFIFSSGLVSGPRINQKNVSFIAKVIKTSQIVIFPVLFGVLRIAFVKSVNYQEHVSEYGVHWNFFFTLACVSLLATLHGTLFSRVSYAFTAVIIIIGYEIALARGLEQYIISAPRVDIISMNREGICSMAGYYCIFLISAEIGARILPKVQPFNMGMIRFKVLTATVGISFLLYLVCTLHLDLQVSRRLANASYVFWVTAVCTSLLAGLFVVDHTLSRIFKNSAEQLKDSPVLFQSLNRYQLVAFIVANILTGLLNLSINTLQVSNVYAMGILFVYASIVSSSVVLLNTWK